MYDRVVCIFYVKGIYFLAINSAIRLKCVRFVSVMMLYRRISLYRHLGLRRLRYGRGRGIHSPQAYSMVQKLIRPYASYYHFKEYSILFKNPLYRLIYRVIVRQQLQEVVLIDQDRSLEEIVRLASSTVNVSHELPTELDNALVVSSNVIDLQVANSSYLILTAIRQTKDGEREFREWVNGIPSGIVLDLYDTALITGIDNMKYIYRTTL